MMQRRQPAQGIQHAEVESKSVKTIGYDEDTQELHVAFHGSGMYVYHNVPKHIHDGLMQSGSKGKFLHGNVKKQFGFTKL